MADAIFPAFLRYYLKYSTRDKWPFDEDGTHLTLFGFQEVFDRILQPFLLEQLRPRASDASYSEDTYRSVYGRDIRMFPRNEYKDGDVLASFTSFSEIPSYLASFQKVARRTAHWDWVMMIDRNNNKRPDKTCYASNTTGSVSDIQYHAHHKCGTSAFRCALVVGYLQSWNASFVGDVDCQLYHGRKGEAPAPVGNVTRLVGLHDRNQTTHQFFVVNDNVPAGRFHLKCTKLDSRFSCITGLSLQKA